MRLIENVFVLLIQVQIYISILNWIKTYVVNIIVHVELPITESTG